MTGMPYFEHLSEMLALFDDELTNELLARVAAELASRGRYSAACYVRRAQNAGVDDLLPSSSSSR